MRALGFKCIEKRIKAIREGEEVPNDILSQILRISSTYLFLPMQSEVYEQKSVCVCVCVLVL